MVVEGRSGTGTALGIGYSLFRANGAPETWILPRSRASALELTQLYLGKLRLFSKPPRPRIATSAVRARTRGKYFRGMAGAGLARMWSPIAI